MAALPESIIPSDPIQGSSEAPGAIVRPTDFGLEGVASTMENVAQMYRRTQLMGIRAGAAMDQRAVEPDLVALKTSMLDTAASDSAKWNGQPGFARDQIAKARFAAYSAAQNPNYTPGQRAEFQVGSDRAIAEFGQRVSEHEAATIQQAGVLQNDVQLSGAKTGLEQDFAPAKQKLIDGYDGSTPGLSQNTMAAFDQAAAANRANVPPQQLPAYDAYVAARRVEEAAGSGATEAKGQDSYALKDLSDQASALVNSVATNPSAYETADSQGLPAIVASMPQGLAGMKKDVLMGFRQQLAMARIDGLISHGETAQAQSEIESGRYDQIMTPVQRDASMAKVDADMREKAPHSLDQAVDQERIRQAAADNRAALITTGQPSSNAPIPADLAKLPYSEQAKILAEQTQARTTYAAVGPVRDMKTPDLLGIARSPPPDPSSPTYDNDLATWNIQHKAAQIELNNRQSDPGAWAFGTDGKGAVRVAPDGSAISVTTDREAALQKSWQAYSANPKDTQAGAHFAGTMLGTQYWAQVPRSSWAILPKAQVEGLAASLTTAPPEGRLAAMQSIAATINGLPASFRMPDGSYASPQQILRDQLVAAKVSPLEISAITDFGGNRAALGRVVAAMNDPTLAKPLPGPQERNLKALVTADLAPELKASAPLPGAQALAQARIDRTVLVARSLMSSGMAPESAAGAAAKDLTGGQRYVDTWHMPESLAATSQTAWPAGADKPMLTDGAGAARAGAGRILADLTANNGHNLYIPAGQDPKAYSLMLQHSARWVTTPDGSGLTLMQRKTDGTWQQTPDRFARPVTASWSDLQRIGTGGTNTLFTPPPAAAPGPVNAPRPAFSKQASFNAVASAIETDGEHGHTGDVSDQGALGIRQVLPKTAAQYGYTDLHRLQFDDAYGREVSNKVLADGANHYGPTPGGVVLNIAAYHDGPGNIEGYTDRKGYHPGLIQRFGDPRAPGADIDRWIDAIGAQAPKTRAYVQRVLPRALANLERGG